MLDRFLRWCVNLDHIHDLAQLDDRMLADLGVERGDIGRAVRARPDARASAPRPAAPGSLAASRRPLGTGTRVPSVGRPACPGEAAVRPCLSPGSG